MMARRASYCSKKIEDFLLAGFGVKVDEFVLLSGGGDEVLQHFRDSRRVSRRVFYPMKV